MQEYDSVFWMPECIQEAVTSTNVCSPAFSGMNQKDYKKFSVGLHESRA